MGCCHSNHEECYELLQRPVSQIGEHIESNMIEEFRVTHDEFDLLDILPLPTGESLSHRGSWDFTETFNPISN